MNKQPSERIDQQKKGKEAGKSKREPLKVKYISSPIMVSARSESEFRAVVQELTGKDSGSGRSPMNTASAAEGSRARDCPTPGKDNVSNAFLEDVYSGELDEAMLWREFQKNK